MAGPAGVEAAGGDEAASAVGTALPRVRTDLGEAEIVDRLDKASRRGKLAGFHRGGAGVGPFYVEVFGQYFDRRMHARLEATADGSGGRVLVFDNRVKRWRVWAFWVVMGLTVWPGVLLTHSILVTYFDWYWRAMWVTCAWYLPLAVVPLPWVWKAAWVKSAAIADAEARQAIGLIAKHLGGRVEG